MYTIYGLCEPDDPNYKDENYPNPDHNGWWLRYSLARRVKYVGITEDVYPRFKAHLSRKDICNLGKNKWLTEHRDNQQVIQLETIQQVESKEVALVRETYWMGYYHFLGADLLNIQKYDQFPSRRDLDRASTKEFLQRVVWRMQDPHGLPILHSGILHLYNVWQMQNAVKDDEFAFAIDMRKKIGKTENYPREVMMNGSNCMEVALARRTSELSWKELFEDRMKPRMVKVTA